MRKNSLNMRKSNILPLVLLIIFCIIWIFPLIWVVNGSFKSTEDWLTYPSSFFPHSSYTFDNFKTLFVGKAQGTAYDYLGDKQPIAKWIFNSLFASTIHTVLYLIIASLAAFAFTFLEFKGRDILFYVLLVSMAIPGIVLTTPQFENIIKLGLSLNIWSIILPGLGGISGVYLMRQFFRGIPKSLIESSSIDGSSKFRTYLTVVLPLSKSVLFVQGLFSFMSVWNDYAWAQIVLGYGAKEGWTLQYGLTYLVSLNKVYPGSEGITLCASLISMIPVFIIYLIVQSRIIEGVALTGVKE